MPPQAIIASSFIPGYAGVKDLPKFRGKVFVVCTPRGVFTCVCLQASRVNETLMCCDVKRWYVVMGPVSPVER